MTSRSGPTDDLGIGALARLACALLVGLLALPACAELRTETTVEPGQDAATEPDAGWLERSIAPWVRAAPSTIRSDDSIAAAILAMQQGRFRRLPVVDGVGRAVGIVSIRDVLAWVADAFPEEFANLPPDPAHEASGLWGG